MLARLLLLTGSVAIGMMTTACSGNAPAARQGTPQTTPTVVAASAASALDNGRAIYQTGKDLSGVQIVANPPAMYPTCAACHQSDGSGGKHLPGGAVSADLRHAALITQQKPPYTLAFLERAISTGVDSQGHALNAVMPRWRLSKQDLHDVSLYVLQGLSRPKH
jgi:mono/diheme cytochrome c family protein